MLDKIINYILKPRLVWLVVISYSTNLAAATPNTCKIFAGDWQGSITNPPALFADGGPWPFKLALRVDGDQVVGISSEIRDQDSGVMIPAKHFQATCNANRLTHIFWGDKKDCGRYSKDGFVQQQKILSLNLVWQNAMTETNFVAKLKKISSTSPAAAQLVVEHFKPNNCH